MLTLLFLCTGNSARSILAEALANHLGAGRLRAYSAGSMPKDAPHPLALELLTARGIDPAGLRSKSWNEFAAPDAPAVDVVITVCDNAAGEVCPIWPGRPTRVHWGIPDPAAAPPDEQPAAFARAYQTLAGRIEAALALPLEEMSPEEVQEALKTFSLATPKVNR